MVYSAWVRPDPLFIKFLLRSPQMRGQKKKLQSPKPPLQLVRTRVKMS